MFMGFHVGKYPVRPMDPSWEMAIHLSTVFFPATMLMEKSLPWPRPHDRPGLDDGVGQEPRCGCREGIPWLPAV